MKEFVAETGGRYTYSDDILNLQELALSMTSIFSQCVNFIVSGCEVTGSNIRPGYVWINGRIRYYEGCNDATFPYYLYEKNGYETVTYANETNKKGRILYLCNGDRRIPETTDPITTFVPQFIEMREDYAPRFIDKFIGRYALLIDSPFSKQTVKKDLVLTGNFNAEKNIESKTAISIAHPSNGYVLKNIVKLNGDASTGAYINGLLVNEIVICTDGSFRFVKQGKELARISETGIFYPHSSSATGKTGRLLLSENSIINYDDASDEGCVEINNKGYQQGNSKYRDFRVYDGKNATPLFELNGKSGNASINGGLTVKNSGKGFILSNPNFKKDQAGLTNLLSFSDNENTVVGCMGFSSNNTFDLLLENKIGNIVVHPTEQVNIQGNLRIKGTDLSDIYVSLASYREEMSGKVNVEEGKQLSQENFSTSLKLKLEGISRSEIVSEGDGFVTARDVAKALDKKMEQSANLNDVADKSAARANLRLYSQLESDARYLRISEKLLELVSLSADEINGLTADEAAALKGEKQNAIRINLDAEKKGTGDLKLSKEGNLNDLANKEAARKNISVYSINETNQLLEKKLDASNAYQGEVFTGDLKRKLEDIRSGNFSYIDTEGISHAQTEGYVSTSQVMKELKKKAERLLEGYNEDEKKSIAANVGIYQKTESDTKFAQVEALFQDYITFLVKQGKTTNEATKTLRDKLDVYSKSEVSGSYLKKDGCLSDLSIPNNDSRKQICRTIGAAFADDYQTRINDTGWLQMANSGSSTNTQGLYVRQIGNIVCIQGTVNTGKRDGTNWGGVVAVIPNQIQPPKYGVRSSLCDFNDNDKYNRGVTFIIDGNTRQMKLFESGWKNVDTNVNFSYMV